MLHDIRNKSLISHYAHDIRNKSLIKDIINQFIIFCKVLDEQRERYGMTERAIKEIISICKDRNVLKEYLERKEAEVVMFMMSLFDDERIMGRSQGN